MNKIEMYRYNFSKFTRFPIDSGIGPDNLLFSKRLLFNYLLYIIKLIYLLIYINFYSFLFFFFFFKKKNFIF